MFIILLRFSSNKALAGQFINEHKTWLNHGFDDGVFVLAGSIQPGLGGTVIAHNCSLSEIQARVDTDPFVQEISLPPKFSRLSLAGQIVGWLLWVRFELSACRKSRWKI